MLWRPEYSEGATRGLRLSTERIDRWTRYLTGLDYSGSTIGQTEFSKLT